MNTTSNIYFGIVVFFLMSLSGYAFQEVVGPETQIDALINAQQTTRDKVAFLENIAITATLVFLPGLISLLWYTESKRLADPKEANSPAALLIYRTTPFITAFFGAFVLYTRGTAYQFAQKMIAIENDLAEKSGLGDLVRVELTTRHIGIDKIPGFYFYGLGSVILGVCFIWCIWKAYNIEKEPKYKTAWIIIHSILVLTLFVEIPIIVLILQ